jgi:hypothetical protein
MTLNRILIAIYAVVGCLSLGAWLGWTFVSALGDVGGW